ncbi:Sir2 family NAD-dependent protein deacetylase [Corallococcus sp. AB050B]|nr:Sir2 family NAD-dependent protein deacetylase [Corallococcus sp. AB050B]
MTNTREIKSLHSQGKLIPLIGAGFSARFKLPTWRQLIDIIAKELNYDPDVFRLCGNELQLAEYYVAKKGNIGPLRSLMDRTFNPSDGDIQASDTHQQLANLNFPLIYTTNYDTIIERALTFHGKTIHTISNLGDIASTPKSVSNITQIVKFHGTFTDDESLVLTESSYFERIAFESPLDLRFRSDILGKSLLFIGYSLSDLNVRYIIHKLNKLNIKERRQKNAPPIGYLTTFSSNEVQKTLLDRWGIEVVELDPIDRNASMLSFLGDLQ